MAGASRSLSDALRRVPVWLVYVVGFVPAGVYLHLGITDQLGADPLKTLEKALGLWALRLLIATLTVTPLRQVVGVNLLRFRRALGLLAFYYAALHLTTYLLLDQGLEWPAILADIVKRPYITAGMVAFTLLIPLAVTSTKGWIRRLGRRWQLLHRLVYVSAIAACLHFLWKVKVAIGEPVYYAAILAVLLGFRVLWRLRPAAGPRRATAGVSSS